MKNHILRSLVPMVFLASCLSAPAEETSPFPRKVAKRTENLVGLKKNRFMVRPFFNTPLRHVSICQGPEDTYYLTGTVASRKDEGGRMKGEGADFQNNDGIMLWKSKDFENWEAIGQVWSIEKQGSEWQKKFRLDPENPSGKPVRGMIHPEIHYLNDTFYIPYSMNGQGTGLLKSESGKAEGPYVDLGQLTTTETAPSIFQDQDGKVYWIWGPGFIAAMNDDLNKLVGPSGLLIADNDLDKTTLWRNWGDEEPLNPSGFFIHRNESGEYIVACSAYNYRNGIPVRDTFSMKAKSLFGPYSRLKPMIPHGGETSIFKKGNESYASFYGADDWSLFRDRPSMVKLNQQGDRIISNQITTCITQRGPWDQMEPIINGLKMNDNQLLNAPDGYYYYCGSVWNEAEKFIFRVFRSKNLRDWEEFEIIDCAQIPGMKGAIEAWKSGEHAKEFQGLAGCPMDPEIHFIDGNYYVVFDLYFGDKYPGVDKALLPHGGFLFKSKTGEALGPYEYHGVVRASQISFLEDDDSTVFVTQGNAQIQKMNPGMKDENQDWNYDIKVIEGINFSTDVGMCPKKIDGKYFLFGYNGFYQNRMMYTSCDQIDGLWSRPKLASTRGAHGWLEKSKHRDDIYYQANWGESMGFNFWPAAPLIIPVKYEVIDGEPTFRSIFDMQPEEARQYQDEIDRVLGPGVWPDKKN